MKFVLNLRTLRQYRMHISVGGFLLIFVVTFKYYVQTVHQGDMTPDVDFVNPVVKQLVRNNEEETITRKHAPNVEHPIQHTHRDVEMTNSTSNGVVVNFQPNITTMEQEYYRLRSRTVNPQNFTFLIENRAVCRTSPSLLVMVPSCHDQADARDAIRNTWGSFNNASMKLIFLFGISTTPADDMNIADENRKHGDIVQADFIDSYTNLTYKILMGLRWSALHCRDADYILKADMDVFVNIPLLMSQLQQKPPDAKGTIYGHAYGVESVVYRKGRWAVPESAFPLPSYPRYTAGNSYVVSANIAGSLYWASQHMPYLPIEDAFITGCLARVLGVQLRNIPGFTFWRDVAPVPCSFVRDKRISANRVTAKMMFSLWTTIKTYPQTC